MPLVPTTRGNRIKYAAEGENTAITPIPTAVPGIQRPGIFQADFLTNPDKYDDEYSQSVKRTLASADPQTGIISAEDGHLYTKEQLIKLFQDGWNAQYGGGGSGNVPSESPAWMSSTVTAPTAKPVTNMPISASEGHDSGIWTNGWGGAAGTPSTPIEQSGISRANAMYPWPVERSVVGINPDGSYVYGKSVATMPDGTKYDAEWAASHADELMKKYYSAPSSNNDYIDEYNSMYELLKKTRKGLTEDQLTQATLKAIGLDDQTLFGGGSGSSNSISPLAAWQLQSQNWEAALPYQINAGQQWAPGFEPGGSFEKLLSYSGTPYNAEAYKAVISNPPGMPSGSSTSTALPSWLAAQTAVPASTAPMTTYPQDIELFKPEQVTNTMGNATQWK